MPMTDENILEVDTNEVICTGEDNSHPKVYYTLKMNEVVSCGYCNKKWKRVETLQ